MSVLCICCQPTRTASQLFVGVKPTQTCTRCLSSEVKKVYVYALTFRPRTLALLLLMDATEEVNLQTLMLEGIQALLDGANNVRQLVHRHVTRLKELHQKKKGLLYRLNSYNRKRKDFSTATRRCRTISPINRPARAWKYSTTATNGSHIRLYHCIIFICSL